jgi:outer membrane protein assembly factor BamB
MPTIKIFDAKDGEIIWNYNSGVSPWWRGIRFSKDERYVVYAGDDYILLLDIRNRRCLWRRQIGGAVYDAMLTRDLSQIVVADKGDNIWCYDRAGKLLWRRSKISVLTDADMTADGRRIVALSHNGIVRMYVRRGNLLWQRTVGFGGHNGIDMTDDGNYIAVGGGRAHSPYEVFVLDKDGNLLWEHSQAGPVSWQLHSYTMSTMTVAISNDASYIVAGYGTANPAVSLFERCD